MLETIFRRSFIALLTLFLLLPPVSRLASDQRVREHFLRFAREDVTPGRISAPVVALQHSEERGGRSERLWRLALMTEDRHIRLYERTGEKVKSVRTGIRTATMIIQDRSGLVYLVELQGSIVRLNIDRITARRIVTPGAASIGAWNDPQGNLYVLGSPRDVSHISAAGVLLWRRSLPSRITTFASDANDLFIATADGRIFRFDSTGQGSVLFRTESPLEQISTALIDRDLVIIGIDAGGEVSAIRSGISGGRRIWSAKKASGAVLIGVDDQGNSWLVDPEDYLVVLSPRGDPKATVRIPGIAISRLAINRSRNRLYVVDAENRLLTVLSDGHIDGSLQLATTPYSVQYLSETDELIVIHTDWRIEVYRGSGTQSPPRVRIPTSIDSPADTRGQTSALRALGDAVLDGTSRSERERLVTTLQNRVDDAQLFGDVAIARSLAIRLLTEPERVPRIDFPDIRIRAVTVLEAFLDAPSRQALSQAIVRDPDHRVASSALKALSRSESDNLSVLDRGYERWRRAEAPERAIIAEGIVSFLEALVGDGGIHSVSERTRIIRVATELSSAAVNPEHRKRTVRILQVIAE